MKTAAIIAEFNPFHDGHKFLIEKCREMTGADNIIVLMSGDYVQRGLPAITENRVRARMALLNGADLIINYPVRFSTSSAEAFAYHAVKILNGLGIVDYLVFGSEEGSVERLREAAEFFLKEPEDYKERLNEYLKEGLSFPAARAKAAPEYADLINTANNILGVEYIKSIIKTGSSMTPMTVLRQKNIGIVSEADTNKFSQGYMVRKKLMEATSMPGLNVDIPENALEVLKSDLNKYGMTSEQDFSLLLADRLWAFTLPEVLANFEDISLNLARSIVKRRNSFESFDEFAEFLQTKNYTRTRINRALLHLILRIRKAEITDEHYYAQIIGINKGNEELPGYVAKNAVIPVFTKYSEAEEKLGEKGKAVFEEDIKAANLYNTVRSQKAKVPFETELSKHVVTV